MPSRLSPDLETAGLLEHTGDNDPYLTQIPLDTVSPGASASPSHSSESSTIVRPSTSSSSNTAKDENLIRDTLPRFAAIGFLRQWFPEVDPEDPRTKGLGRKLSNRDVALIIHQSIAGVVLIFNIIVTTLALRARGPSSGAGGIVDVPEVTNCDQVRSYNMGLHLVINFLSTILLGSSNYCAQLLVAPTRKDIEQAHAKRRTLDIGIQSFRNLRAVDTPRRLLWVLLMISSGLLHLIWNTVVFAASPKVSYNVGVVTSDYLKDTTPWNYPMAGFDAMRQNVTGLTPISRAECIERYTDSDNGLSDVLLVARNISKHDQLSFAIDNSSSLLSNFSAFDAATNGGGSKGIRWSQANSWVCSAWTPLGYYASPPDSERTTICSDLAMKAYVDSWTFTRWEETPAAPSGVQLWAGVDHCIPASDLHPMDDICALRVSGTLLVIVCGLNLIKVICIFFTARLHSSHFSNEHKRDEKARTAYLVTVGDAIASFLEQEDDYTKELSLADQSDFRRGKWPDKMQERAEFEPSAKLRIRRWFSSVSILQWISTLLLCAGFMIFVSVELGQSLNARKSGGLAIDLLSLWSYGIGTAHAWSVSLTGALSHMSQEDGFFFATVYVNVFQIIVSGLYLLCNNIITVMLMASEWNSYRSKRRPLRVSCPRGYQRSTYFLSLPYRYSLPLMAASSALHWLVSQSIFVIQTIAYQTPAFDRAPDLDGSLVGTSPIAMLLAVVVGGAMIFTMLGFSVFSKYKPSPIIDNGKSPSYPAPLVGTCSAAISAACHAHPEDRDPTLLPIRWGYVQDDPEHPIGRFRFSTARDIVYPTYITTEKLRFD